MTTTGQAKQVKPVWKCKVVGCDYSAEPTVGGYRKMSGHQLAHAGMPKEKKGFSLIDERTGEVLAQKLSEATEKGFIVTEASEPPISSEPVPEVEELGEPEEQPSEEKPKAKGDKGEKEVTEPEVSSEGIFRYTVTLPADAFTLFNMAKAAGLEKDGNKSFDEWLWDCIRKRYEKDYKMQVVLAGIEEE